MLQMIAKLVCSRHKPGQQTIIADEAIPYVFKYTRINAVRNLGGKLGDSLMTKYNITVDFCIFFMSTDQEKPSIAFNM